MLIMYLVCRYVSEQMQKCKNVIPVVQELFLGYLTRKSRTRLSRDNYLNIEVRTVNRN